MNFALILFLLTLATGVLWFVDRVYFSPSAARRDAPEPAWVEYAASFFPVLLVVFLLRSFIAEPFKIPSSSMRPTLEVGDFILVNKFVYGLRLPIVEAKVVPMSEPARGDVVVFRYPVNPSQDFIKRVVGVGGDVVSYQDKQLTVNGQPLPQVRGRHDTATSRTCASRRSSGSTRTASNDGATHYVHDRHEPAGRARVPAERPPVSGPGELRLQ
jgi:signal peptidase I